MRSIYLKVTALCLIALFTLGCSKKESPKRIDLSRTVNLDVSGESDSTDRIKIAVGGMITPREGFAYYKQLLEYIGTKLGTKVEFVDRENYAEINKLMQNGAIDVAFVCGGPYVDGQKKFGMELLAAPRAYGETVYYSYIIVHKESAIKTFEDLRGKTFAFTDPLSNSGKLVPTYMLAKINETANSFFKSHDFTYAHDKSIKAVAEGLVDGAAVDSLIWEYAQSKNSPVAGKTKVITKSLPYGIPPVAVRPDLDNEIKEKLKGIFLSIHNDREGKSILKGMMVEKFVPISDSAYDSIRVMKEWLDSNKSKQEKTG